MNFKIVWAGEHEENSTGSGQGTLMEYCNLGNISSVYVRGGKFSNHMTDYQFSQERLS